MAQVVIGNHIGESSYEGFALHFKFPDEDIAYEICEYRRASSCFIPIRKPKDKGKQIALENLKSMTMQNSLHTSFLTSF